MKRRIELLPGVWVWGTHAELVDFGIWLEKLQVTENDPSRVTVFLLAVCAVRCKALAGAVWSRALHTCTHCERRFFDHWWSRNTRDHAATSAYDRALYWRDVERSRARKRECYARRKKRGDDGRD